MRLPDFNFLKNRASLNYKIHGLPNYGLISTKTKNQVCRVKAKVGAGEPHEEDDVMRLIILPLTQLDKVRKQKLIEDAKYSFCLNTIPSKPGRVLREGKPAWLFAALLPKKKGNPQS